MYIVGMLNKSFNLPFLKQSYYQVKNHVINKKSLTSFKQFV